MSARTPSGRTSLPRRNDSVAFITSVVPAATRLRRSPT